jgi:hypothetical protein
VPASADNVGRPQTGLENASRPRSAAPAVLGIVLLAVVAVAGIGGLYRLSAGKPAVPRGADTVELRVSKDFGAATLTERHVAVTASATVMPLLTANARVVTAYGGGFVDSIDDVSSGYTNGGSVRADWFYYVNGLQATVGASDYHLGPRDRVWWDFHAWDFAPSVPAVVGQYPEPFLSGAGDRPLPTRIVYAPAFAQDAAHVVSALRSAGVAKVTSSQLAAGESPPHADNLILLGTWADLTRLAWVREAADSPAGSGLFARYENSALVVLDVHGKVTKRDASAGAIMATMRADAPGAAIWIVTGDEPYDVSAAASLLAQRPSALAGRFGVLVEPSGAVTPLPIGVAR